MSFNFISTIPFSFNEEPFVYPSVGVKGELILEAHDEEIQLGFNANSVEILSYNSDLESFRRESLYNNLEWRISITKARIVFHCIKPGKVNVRYTNLLSSAIDKAVAVATTSGRVLSGHLRYEWIIKLGYMNTQTNKSDEIIIFYQDKSKMMYQVILTGIQSNLDPLNIAAILTANIANYRIHMNDDKTVNEVKQLEQMLDPNFKFPLSTHVKKHGTISFPNPYYAPLGKSKRPQILIKEGVVS